MLPYQTLQEAEEALGRAATFAEKLWFTYSAKNQIMFFTTKALSSSSSTPYFLFRTSSWNSICPNTWTSAGFSQRPRGQSGTCSNAIETSCWLLLLLWVLFNFFHTQQSRFQRCCFSISMTSFCFFVIGIVFIWFSTAS